MLQEEKKVGDKYSALRREKQKPQIPPANLEDNEINDTNSLSVDACEPFSGD